MHPEGCTRRQPGVHHVPQGGLAPFWPNNPNERLIHEARRRTDVVETFPDRACIIRRVGAVLTEQHDEMGRRPKLPRPRCPGPSAQKAVTTNDEGGASRSAPARHHGFNHNDAGSLAVHQVNGHDSPAPPPS
ncbi:transposase [Nocardioides guangzhouensis]|uniref:transposase n=1 Tax=Nocardioides guangzhouensis TaxID=2497878 RepID=UPI003CCC677D